MNIIFSRHGNTFEPNTPAVWVGCESDLPLVEAGIEQAKTFAKALSQSGIKIDAVYCGPLKRTLSYAQIILKELQSNLTPIVDLRLSELNYGGWAGLTNQQIGEKYGIEMLENWEKHCKWPLNVWKSSEPIVREEVVSFANDLVTRHKKDDVILVISSNGKLRYFLSLIPGEFEERVKTESVKIKTGNVCRFAFVDDKWKVNYWNRPPSPEIFYSCNEDFNELSE